MTASEQTMPYAKRLFELLRRRAPAIAVFVVLLGTFDATRAWTMSDIPNGFLEGLVTLSRVNWVMIVIATMAPCLAEATELRAVPRGLMSALATFSLVALFALAIGAAWDGPITEGVQAGRLLSNEAFLLRSAWFYSVAGLLFAAYCQTREREVATLRAARAMELVRLDSQRDIMASRLQVLQARVEPELLFGALGDVRRAYLSDPAMAGALLDDLIAYLRAALPQMRGGMSTLQREVALAEAYLKVVPAGRHGGLAVDVDIAADAGGAPFPPMVLLPLAHAASESEPSTIRISAPFARSGMEAGVASVGIVVADSRVPAGWEETQLAAIRGALQNYFGSVVSMRVERTADSVSAVVTWPESHSTTEPAAGATIAAA